MCGLCVGVELEADNRQPRHVDDRGKHRREPARRQGNDHHRCKNRFLRFFKVWSRFFYVFKCFFLIFQNVFYLK